MITVPPEFAASTIAREGEPGRVWIDRLPQTVADLCEKWELTPDGPVLHGYLGVVLLAKRRGEPCALKVCWTDETTRDEAAALQAWGGHGAVRLLEASPSEGAMLLERLDYRR